MRLPAANYSAKCVCAILCVRVSMPTCRVTRDLREVKHVYQNVKVTFARDAARFTGSAGHKRVSRDPPASAAKRYQKSYLLLR